MSWQAMVPAPALIPISLIAGAGPVYRVAACVTSAAYLYYSGRLAFERSNLAAKRLLMVSIIYAPLEFWLILLDKA
jgi:heme O synthase-like polyprenyltransferase